MKRVASGKCAPPARASLGLAVLCALVSLAPSPSSPLPGEPPAVERILYEVKEGVLWREAPGACGGARAIARNVGALTRDGSGILFVYRRPLRPGVPLDVPVRVGLAEVLP